MSGGHFEYKQYGISDIADVIDSLIRKNGKELTSEEIRERYGYGYPSNWLEKYPEDRFHYKYSDEVALTLGGNLFGGDEDYTLFGQFQDNNNIYTRVRYSF